jgi:hypothetical protein
VKRVGQREEWQRKLESLGVDIIFVIKGLVGIIEGLVGRIAQVVHGTPSESHGLGVTRVARADRVPVTLSIVRLSAREAIVAITTGGELLLARLARLLQTGLLSLLRRSSVEVAATEGATEIWRWVA